MRIPFARAFFFWESVPGKEANCAETYARRDHSSVFNTEVRETTEITLSMRQVRKKEGAAHVTTVRQPPKWTP